MRKSEAKAGSVQILSWALLVLLLLAVPRGCSSVKVVVGVDKDGRSGVFVFQDPSLIQQIRERELFSAGEGLVEKRDYFFWIDYYFKARARVEEEIGGEPLYLELQLPGTVREGNADEIREGKAYWLLNSGRGEDLRLKSRGYRYYVIFACLFAIFSLLFSCFQKGAPLKFKKSD